MYPEVQTRVVVRYPRRDQDPRLNSAIAVSTDRNGALPCQPSGALPPGYELHGSRLLPILASVEHQGRLPAPQSTVQLSTQMSPAA